MLKRKDKACNTFIRCD